nr:reverse transcriptase domain-containing protein [Tanacetum cinerariifolium]
MRTRSSSNLIVESFTIPKRRNRRRFKQTVKPELRTIVETPVANMADTRTMSELLQAPTEGYEDAIVIPAILAENFELKVRLLSLVTSSQFYVFERDDPHAHIRWFNKITYMLKYKNVPHDAIKFMLFSFSFEGAAWTWLEKEPSRSIHTWEDLVSKFVSYLFPHLKTTNLKNDITNFQQIFDETFSEACNRFKDLLCKCRHHGFSELHQIDTFYNALTQSDQDSLNAAADGNLLNRTPLDALMIIENKSKATQQATVKSIEETCVICGGSHPYYECLAAGGNTFDACAAVGSYNQGESVQSRSRKLSSSEQYEDMQTQMSNMKTELRNEFKSSIDTKTNKIENQNNQIMNMLTNLTIQRQSPSSSGSLLNNTIANPRGDVKAITAQSGVAYERPSIPPTSSSLPKEVEREPEVTKDKVQTTSSESIAHVQPLVVQVPIPKPKVVPKPNPKPSIPYPSRLNDQKLREKTNSQMLKFLQIFQRLHFDLSFADALLHIPKFAYTFKSLLSNKEKLFELANTPLTENCSAKLSLLDLTPTRMTLMLATRCFAYPTGIAEDVFMQVGKFTFPADFVVVDYDVNPRVPLISGRPFLRTHGNESINMINFIDITCKDRFPEVLKFKKSNHPSSGSTTPLSNFSPSLTHFETSDSLLEEFADELALLDRFPPGNEDEIFYFKADFRKIKYLLNQDPSTESDVEIIDLILEKFTDEPAIDYSPSPRDDDDDLFDFKFDNNEWKKFLYGNCYKDIDYEKDKNKDSKMKSLEPSEISSLSSSPFENEDKVFNPGILILGGTQIFNDEFKDKDLRDKDLILEERNFLFIFSDQELLFFLELTVIETLLSFSSEKKDKVFNPEILISNGVHYITLESSHRTYETFKIINIHPNIFNEGPMKIFPFFCFCPKDKGIRGETS